MCSTEIVLVGDRGLGSRQWCTKFSEVCGLRELLGDGLSSSDASFGGMIGVAGELDCFSAYIRLREPDKSEDQADPEGLSYPKAKRRSERRWSQRSATVSQRRIYRSRRKGRRCKATDIRAMGLVAAWYRRGGTSLESSIPCSYGGRALVVKGAEEVENAEANSKYQDKDEE
ncbi:hypothetical protein BHE74_00024772 [Ensete ventricosum]|nr:hypothetical protein BHE74_00024772 [Ensete ventricosum]